VVTGWTAAICTLGRLLVRISVVCVTPQGLVNITLVLPSPHTRR